ncbi:MAG: glycosyltransferase family 39 protein, partial [Deltaproteobacteria bacterium]|nr:glycosyltransferase family 39 protein [Deltaproteobacteria bacterium]
MSDTGEVDGSTAAPAASRLEIPTAATLRLPFFVVAIFVVAIFLVAFGARLFGIETESIWVDEAFSIAASQGELSQVLETAARDTHPPGYFLGLHLWRGVMPDSDGGIRAYSTLWSLLGLLFLLLLVRDTLGAGPALLAGLLMAVNPLDLYFAQEARMYSQAAALGSASAWLLWRWLGAWRAGQPGRAGLRWAAGYALAATALLYTHYVTATLLLAQGIYALGCLAARRQWRGVATYLGLSLVVALAFLPWLLYVLGFRDSFYASQVLSYMPVPSLEDYLSLPGREWLWGRVRTVHDPWWGLTLLLPLSIFAAAAWAGRGRAAERGRREALVFVAGLVVTPLLISALVGQIWETVYFRPRFPVLVLPGFLALLSCACISLPRRALSIAAALLCAGVMVAGSVAQHYTSQKRAWRETASHWPGGTQPAFYVIFPPEQQRPLRHYLAGRIRHTPRAVLERLMPLPAGTLIWVGSWPEG